MMACNYIKKTRNMRSVYDRSCPDHAEELTEPAGDCQDKSVCSDVSPKAVKPKKNKKLAAGKTDGHKQSVTLSKQGRKCGNANQEVYGDLSNTLKSHDSKEKTTSETTPESHSDRETFVSSTTLSRLKSKVEPNCDSVKVSVKSDTGDSCSGEASEDCGESVLRKPTDLAGEGTATQSATGLTPQDDHGDSKKKYKQKFVRKTKQQACSVCQKIFSNPETLKIHEQNHSEQDKVDNEQDKVDKGEIECQKNVDKLAQLTCKVCQKVFKNVSMLARHELVHSGARPFVCETCGTGFTQFSNLKVHKLLHTSERRYICDVCSKGFIRRNQLKEHRRIHTGEKPFVCEICNTGFARMHILKAHWKVHSKHFACDHCDLRFHKAEQFKSHVQNHHPSTKRYECEACQKTFVSQRVLRNHMLIHEGFKHVCHVCGLKVSGIPYLKKHMMIHTGERPYVCDVCNKGYIQKGEYVIHLRTHTGEKPFLCNICSAAFARKANLQLHISAVHLGKKPFTCDVCNRSFAGHGTLKDHKLIHAGIKPHMCKDCGKCFTQSSSLKSHSRVHTGEKPYACDHCPKRFAGSGRRKRHLRTHTGEMPYKGAQCPDAFSRPEHYKDHLKYVHLNDVSQPVPTTGQPSVNTALVTSQSGVVVAQVGLHVSSSKLPQNIPSEATGAVQSAEVFGDAAMDSICDIPSGPTIVVESVENAHDTASSYGKNSRISVGKCRIFPSDTNVIHKSLSLPHSNHLSSLSFEIMESTVIKQPVTPDQTVSESQFTHEKSNVSDSVIIEPSVGIESMTPRIIEVKFRLGGVTEPPDIIEMKMEGDTASSGLPSEEQKAVDRDGSSTACLPVESEATHKGDLSSFDVESVSDNIQVVYHKTASGSAADLAVGRMQIVYHDNASNSAADSTAGDMQSSFHDGASTSSRDSLADDMEVVCHENTSGAAAKNIQLVYAENSPTITVNETQAHCHEYVPNVAANDFQAHQAESTVSLMVTESQTDFDDENASDTAVAEMNSDHARNTPSPKVIDLQEAEDIHVIPRDLAASDDAANDQHTSVEDQKPWPESIDKSSEYIYPVRKRFYINSKIQKDTVPIKAEDEASAFEEAMKKGRRVWRKCPRRWMCEICGKGFTQLSGLKMHMTGQHKNCEGRSFVCEVCSKTCVSKSELASHRRSHTGERPFTCQLCPNTYKHKSDLRQHILSTHMGKRPFACDLCDQTFTLKRHLKDHRLIHLGIKPHRCLTCGKAFTQSGSLRNHSRIHSDVKPWVCQYCGKKFNDRCGFNRHQRIHTGEKPYQCSHCPCAFGRLDQLKRHLNKEHPEDLQNLTTLADAVATLT